MQRVCNWRCFVCPHPDCINDSQPSAREIAIIEADDRYVQWMRLTDSQKHRRLSWRKHSRLRHEKKQQGRSAVK